MAGVRNIALGLLVATLFAAAIALGVIAGADERAPVRVPTPRPQRTLPPFRMDSAYATTLPPGPQWTPTRPTPTPDIYGNEWGMREPEDYDDEGEWVDICHYPKEDVEWGERRSPTALCEPGPAAARHLQRHPLDYRLVHGDCDEIAEE